MKQCARCGTEIKNAFKFNGQFYGSECIKHIVDVDVNDLTSYTYHVNGIDFRHHSGDFYNVDKYIDYINKQKADQELDKIRHEIMYIILKEKDMSKIRSDFKKQVIPSIIEQYEKKGKMSEKQYTMVNEWLTPAENQKFIELLQQKTNN